MNCNTTGIQLVTNMWGLIDDKEISQPVAICFDVEGKFRKHVEVKGIMCILTSYKGHQDVLELKEEDLILLQDEIQGTNDAFTLTEVAEVANDMMNQNKHVNRQGHTEEKEAFCQGSIEYLYYH